MSQKAEARINRALAKSLKVQARTVRQAAEPQTRVVRSDYLKDPARQVRVSENPGSIFNMTMRWTIEWADRAESWSWGVPRDWGDEQWSADLRPKLEEFGKLTWAEIERQAYGNEGKRHRCHHPMETCEIGSEALARLVTLERELPDTIFRFRLGNLPRLWGFRIVDQFQVLWFDPTHKVYPVD